MLCPSAWLEICKWKDSKDWTRLVALPGLRSGPNSSDFQIDTQTVTVGLQWL